MTADQIIEELKAHDIVFSAEFEVNLRKGWDLNQSQATDKYLALSDDEKTEVCRKAIAARQCDFCGAPPGKACGLVPRYNKPPFDDFCHCGRWMKFLMAEAGYDDLSDLFGPPPRPDTSSIDDLL